MRRPYASGLGFWGSGSMVWSVECGEKVHASCGFGLQVFESEVRGVGHRVLRILLRVSGQGLTVEGWRKGQSTLQPQRLSN
mmetsp:Transcript_31694/g.49614  ORF Transcript_31694/g.49614 Transcript_31694/m.49614 type:complete len:81 (+) Transcript_31694:876-1118(+)